MLYILIIALDVLAIAAALLASWLWYKAGRSRTRRISLFEALDARARAVPVGLITNELVTNALKYAFPDDRAGTVCIRFWREGEEFVLAVEDDGIGLPDTDAAPKGTGLGRRLIRALAAQLGGRLAT